MPLASPILHGLMTARAHPAHCNLSPELQAHRYSCCLLDFVPWGPSGYLSPSLFCRSRDSPSQDSNYRLP